MSPSPERTGLALTIEEQEAELDEQERRNAERRRFDEGFAEYERARADEQLEAIEADEGGHS
jgi:hypothetical protein